MRRLLYVIPLLLVSTVALGANVWSSFTSGTTISSSAVNDNFEVARGYVARVDAAGTVTAQSIPGALSAVLNGDDTYTVSYSGLTNTPAVTVTAEHPAIVGARIIALSSTEVTFKLVKPDSYSAQIANDGTNNASIASQTGSFIASVADVSPTGDVLITYDPTRFTEPPAVTIAPRNHTGNVFFAVSAGTALSVRAHGDQDGGSDYETDFTISVQAQGADFEAPQQAAFSIRVDSLD